MFHRTLSRFVPNTTNKGQRKRNGKHKRPLHAEPLEVRALLTRIAFVDATVWTEDTAPSELTDKADEVVFLDANSDGIQQMADYLDGRSGVEAIDIISHGDTGQISPVGNAIINVDNIADYSNQLTTIGGALHADGDILLWGCGVAGTDGTNFVQAIADGTGADVASSYDTTGTPSLGGDWDLEFATGPIEAENLLEDISPSITLSHNQPPIVSTFGALGQVTDGQGTQILGYTAFDPNGNLTDVSASVRRDGFGGPWSNASSHAFSIPNTDGLGTFELFVTARDSGGLTSTAVRTFTRVDDDTSGPSISFTNAVNQNDGQDNIVGWNISDTSGIASRAVRLYSGSGTGGPTIFSNSSNNSGSFNLNSLSPGTYTISATATDADTDRGAADQSSFQNIRTFTISDDDTSGPIISLVSPSTQPQGVGASANFTLSENFASRLSSYTARLFVGSSSTQALPPIAVTLATANGSGPTSFSDGFDMSGLGPGTYRFEVTASNNDRDYGTADIESRSSTPQFITIFNPNDPPVADDDIAGEAAISEDAGDTDITNAILANDSDPDGDAFSVVEITDGVSTVTTSAPGSITLANGAIVSLDGSGSVSFDPNGQFESLGSSEFDTTSSFDYTIADTSGETDTASVNVTINGVNDQPIVTASGPFSLDENRDIGFVVGSVSASDVDASDTNLTFGILGGNTGGAFAIDATTGQISVANKAAVDFETNPTFNLTIEVDDNNAEGNSTNTSIVVIELKDLHATLAMADASDDEANGPIVFDVTLTGDVINSPFDVTYSTIDGTAQNAGFGVGSNDYAGTASSTISFDGDTASETRQISVAVNDDSVVETDENFFVNLLATSSNDVSFVSDLGSTVVDQENPGPYNSGLAARIIYTWRQEVVTGIAGKLDGIDLYLTNPGELDVAINVGAGVQSDTPEFSNTVASPTSGRVFIDTSEAEIILGVGDTFVIEVTGSEDGVGLEGSYFSPGPGRYPGRLFLDSFERPSLDLRFRSHVSPFITAQSATGTITNDDSATISIDNASVTEGGDLVFNVSLTNPVDVDTEVTYSTADGSASSADSDYAGQTAQPLTIPAGQTSGTITVATTADNKVELDESMTVNLTAVSADGRNVTIDDGTAEGTIINDDNATISIDNASVIEGNPGDSTQLVFNVTLDSPVDTNITFDYETQNGTAISGQDFDAISSTLTIAAGDMTGQITVDVTEELFVEPDETLTVVAENLQSDGRDVTLVGAGTTGSGGWTQLGSDIDGEDAFDSSGFSVAMSADGNTVVIGAPLNDDNGSNSGHARVYRLINGNWMQVGNDIDGESAADLSGFSVAMNAAGDTVVVGANGNDGNGDSSGHARVYRLINGSWTQLGADIDGETAGDQSGFSVAMSADGNTVVIGAINNDGNGNSSGHARVFRWSGSSWTQLGTDIDGEAAGDQSGRSVGMSADGNTLVIGAVDNDGSGGSSGHARVYRLINGSWTQLGADIDGEAAFDRSGFSVAMSAAGNTVVVGALLNDGNGINSGHTRVYRWTGGSWTQLGTDIDGEVAGDQSGLSVSMSPDGNTVVIGAFFNDGNGTDSGHARVYRWSGSSWTQLGNDFDGEAAADWSGYSVAMNAEGNTVIVGARYNDDGGLNSGHARIYTLTSADVTATGTIQNDDLATISIDDASVTEGGDLMFNVSLTSPVDVDTEITYSTADGSATTSDLDYAGQTAQTLTIPAGQTSGTITVATTADNKVELNETMTVNLTAVTADGRNVTIDDGTAEGTIINDDDAVVSLSAEAKSEGTAGTPTTYTFEIELSNPVDVLVDMTADTQDGSATAANDYTAISGQAVSFAPGSTETQTVTVNVTADDIVELDEAFDLVLRNLVASGRAVTFAGSAATESATAEVINDDSATLSLDDVSQSETDGATTFTFTISATNEVDTDVSIGFQTADGSAQSATAGVGSDDYQTAAGTATIATGDTSTVIDVTVNGDDVVENTENFFLELLVGTLNPGGREVTIADGTGEATITNDDTASLIIDDLSIVESDAPGSTEFVFTVSIDPTGTGTASEEDITVVARTSGVTATGGGVDFSDVINHTLTVPAGTTTTTITIDVVRENLAETDETFQVKLTDAEFAGGTDVSRVVIGDATGIGTIENDDFAPIANVGQPYSINEGDGLTLDALDSTDDDDAVAGLTFRWDVDGDGDFDENVTGANPTLTSAQMSVLGLADGPHINDVTVEASDGTNIDTATTTLTIENVNPTGNADAGDVNEDGPATTIAVLANDADPAGVNDPLRVTAVDTSGTSGSVSFTPTDVSYDPNGKFESLDEGATTTDSFEYTVSDGDGGSSTGSVTVTIHGQNDAPVAYPDSEATDENDSVMIDVLANDSDVDTGDNPSNFSLDSVSIVSTAGLSGSPAAAGSASIVNNQLVFDPGSDYDELAVGETATVTIDYTMSDDSGLSSASTAVVTIHGTNDAPVITSLISSNPTPDAKSTDGQVAIDGAFTDLDLSDVHSVAVDWGDGSPVEHVMVDQAADTFAAEHEYAIGGVFTITVTVDDGNGGTDTHTTSAVSQGVGLVDGVLYIIGTDGRDHVNLRFNEKKDELKVDVKLDQGRGPNINETFATHAVDQVVTYLCGGDDHYNGDGNGGNGGVGAAAEISQFVFGGDGNDHLSGGNGNDVLSGGAGNDDLFGRSGSDILIGGFGRGKVKGGDGDDLLIGGSTDSENKLESIEAALADWTNGDLAAAMIDLGTLTEDGDRDDLKGESGDDELVGGTGDKLFP